MDDLPHDILVALVGHAGPEAAQILHMVSKAFCAAARASPVALRPGRDLSPVQLLQACHAFPRAISLDLSECELLTLDSLQAILALLPGLISLRADDCAGLSALPDTAGGLSCLRQLSFERCSALKGLTDGISALTGLWGMSFMGCSTLPALPAGLGTLAQLLYLGARRSHSSPSRSAGSPRFELSSWQTAWPFGPSRRALAA